MLVKTLMVRSMCLDLVEDDTCVLEFDAMFIVKTILCHRQFDCLSMRYKPVFLSQCTMEDCSTHSRPEPHLEEML